MSIEKRKLYIVTQNYPYGNGEKTFIEPELKIIRESGQFDITIISTAELGIEKTSETEADIQVIHIPKMSMFKNVKRFLLGIRFGIHFWILKSAKSERETLSKRKVGLGAVLFSMIYFIQANFFYNDLMKRKLDFEGAVLYTYWCSIQTLAFALHKSEWKGVKLISRIHRADLYDECVPYGRQPFRHLIDEQLDRLFFIAENGRAYYTDKIGYRSEEKHKLSRLGTECMETYDIIKMQQKEAERFLLVSCSNIIFIKHLELIIQALALLKDDILIDWIHFGDGSERKMIEEKAKHYLNMKNNIKYCFRGWTDNKEILEFYGEYRVECFITASESEGCPVSIQEAMSFGIPIIATAVGEIPFMIQQNGILLSENPSPEEIAQAIKEVCIASRTDRDRMRQKSRELWEKYFNAEKNYRLFAEELTGL